MRNKSRLAFCDFSCIMSPLFSPSEKKTSLFYLSCVKERREYEESLRRFIPDAYYQGIPFKVPDLRRLFNEDEIKDAALAIDEDDESDFEKHPYRILVAMIVTLSRFVPSV